MPNIAAMKLGKKAVRHDPRTLRLGAYLGPSLPPAPAGVNWSAAVPSWPMMANDKWGDCTCAAAGHMVQTWTGNQGKLATPTDADVIRLYEEVTAEEGNQFDPATGANDNGAVELDVLNLLRKTGIGGHTIDAFVSVSVRNPEHLRQGCYLFGGLYIGLALPIQAQNQDIWQLEDDRGTGEADPGSWGGHAVCIVDYDADTLTCVTWGKLQKMTWDWFAKYCDEAYALLSKDWTGPNLAPNQFDFQQLEADLKAL